MIEYIEYVDGDQAVVLSFEDGRRYEIQQDPYTGDWHVLSEDETSVLCEYLMTRDDAVKYVLHWEDVLEEADYELAPDRC